MKIKLNNAEVEIDEVELKKIIAEHPELLKKKSFGESMIGKTYYKIDVDYNFCWVNSDVDIRWYNLGRIFWSIEEREREFAKRAALARIKIWMFENDVETMKDVDWKRSNQEKYCICGWNYVNNTPIKQINTCWYISKYDLIFSTQEDLDKVLAGCKEDLAILLK